MNYIAKVFLLISITPFNLQSDNQIIIDVRTESEWTSGHLETAIHIPLSDIDSMLDSLEKYRDTDIYLYCAAGRRAEVARNILIKAGFKNITNAGGIKDASELLNFKIIE